MDQQQAIWAAGGGGLIRSTDAGATWSNPLQKDLTLISLAVSPYGHVFAGDYNGGVERSTDNGSTRAHINVGDYTTTRPLCLLADEASTVFAGTFLRGLFRSTDSGEHWMVVAFPDRIVRSLTRTGAGTILASVSDYETPPQQLIYRSTDDGTTWLPADPSSRDAAGWDFAVNKSGAIFSGDNATGVFRSTDDGISWSPFNQGLPCLNVQGIALDASGCLYAATYGHGVYRSVQSTTSAPEEEGREVESFSLLQNYPNPFNPTTVVSYQLPVAGDVRLTVYDILGREVTVLVDEKKAAGSHEVTFDATGMASGVYVYRLQVAGFTQTLKMVVVR